MANWVRDRNLFSARFPVDPARKDEFIQAFEQLCASSEDFYNRGCTFAFQGWARDTNEFVVFASWDEDVVQELRLQPEFQKFNQTMLDCCSGPLIMEQYSGMNKDRSVFDIYPTGSSKVHKAGKVQEVVFL